MDFIKKAKESLSGEKTNTSTGNVQQQGGSASNEDYGDKALNFIEKKTGHTMSRDTNEKITDGVRGMYEKATGKKVDPKYSN